MDTSVQRESSKQILKKSVSGIENGIVETLYTRGVHTAQLPSGVYKKIIKTPGRRIRKKKNGKKRHYRIVSISLYERDIQKLEEHVRFLKGRGHTKANKSQVIRFAIDRVAIATMPRAY